MKFDDYRKHDAVGLAGLVAKGEVSAGELLETAVARMAEVNPRLNAVTLDLADRARKETAAAAPTGPLAGVPYLLKDLGALLAGTPTTGGSALWKDNVPAADSAIVTAYKQAGLVIFGKTNTPEFGLMPVTEPDFLGVCRNPWDTDRTPGGSSGGAASAVAAGIVPAAHASDGGGSIRTPAAACGLFGMKPSRGRVSFAPLGEGWGGASIQHAVTRSVRDSAVLLDAVCRPQSGDPYYLDAPATPFAQEVGRAPGRLRIGFTTAALAAPALDPECAQAVLDAAKLCESLGHIVEEVTVSGDLAAMQAAAGDVIAASVAATLEAEGEKRGRAVTADDVELLTWAMARRGQQVTGASYVRGLAAIHAYGRAVAELFKTYDVLLLSTLGSPAIPIGWLTENFETYAPRLFDFMPNTQAFNNTGQPAMTVPLSWSTSGLPIGLQFVAGMANEAVLFRLAGQLEQARPWFDRVAEI
ncbi:amidase [Phenylobacterium aquaticum]|uniref:amidase n=1 Tax=Phenylobacterium aquaticum TaxID=1763816 RepID=UPI001F5E13D5|nr:amidase [Phenylobacterium aquaticum]MCI3133758.1 amidase [Phenylobacterium aquaticum]